MNKSKFIKYLAVAILLIIVAGGFSFLGSRATLDRLTIKSVSPTQIANAMKNDNFYSSYNENTLIVRGVISTVSKQGSALVVGFDTGSSFKALCDLGNSSATVRKGTIVTVLAEGATAERQPNAVMLKNCVGVKN